MIKNFVWRLLALFKTQLQYKHDNQSTEEQSNDSEAEELKLFKQPSGFRGSLSSQPHIMIIAPAW